MESAASERPDYGREAGRMALDDLHRLMCAWVADHSEVLAM